MSVLQVIYPYGRIYKSEFYVSDLVVYLPEFKISVAWMFLSFYFKHFHLSEWLLCHGLWLLRV